MQDVIDSFATMPPVYRRLMLGTGLVVFWVIEGTVPLFPFQPGRYRHAAINLSLTLFQLLIALLMGTVLAYTAQSAAEYELGLLRIIDLPLIVQAAAGILILDFFVGYVCHRVQHTIPVLWRFHLAHHSDTKVDVTTGLRHHPIETLVRFTFMLMATLLGGVSIGVIFMYQVIAVLFAQLTHANVRIPDAFDRFFARVFVSPNMHKVHHHFRKPLTNRNYGNVFSFWDRLLRTFAEVPAEKLTYGIDSIPSSRDNDRLVGILQAPFRRQRESPGVTGSDSVTASTDGR